MTEKSPDKKFFTRAELLTFIKARDKPFEAFLIFGPTASGKSDLALALSEKVKGTVINADSMQVYRDLRIITNRPTLEEETRAPHRLYGFRSGAEPYSAALWLADLKTVLTKAKQDKQVPIIVGGTGLYFKALLQGLSTVPDIPLDVRSHMRARLERESSTTLHAELVRLDPNTASRIRPTDPQRIIRALEVIEATGRSLSEWQKTQAPPLIAEENALCLTLNCTRNELYSRSDARFDKMIADGAVEEISRLLKEDLPSTLPIMRAVGVPPIVHYLKGELTFSSAIEKGKQQTRNYIKRQQTWLKNNFISFNSII